MRLIPVRDDPRATQVLYDLLAERGPETFISHKRMPSFEEHERFVAGHPFRYWYLMACDRHYVGQLQCTDRNEIGIEVFKAHQHKGYAHGGLVLFLEMHEPLPPIPAVRNGAWLANVAPTNERSRRFFERNGFRAIQVTMERAA